MGLTPTGGIIMGTRSGDLDPGVLDYMQAYRECLSATSTPHVPWYAIPADHKDNARLIVSQIVIDVLTELKMSYPMSDAKRRQELQSIREQLIE
jgi:hypothetical protein